MARHGHPSTPPLIRRWVYAVLLLGVMASGSLALILGWEWHIVLLLGVLWGLSLGVVLRLGASEGRKSQPAFPLQIACPKSNSPCGVLGNWVKIGGDLLMVLSYPMNNPEIRFVGPGFEKDMGWDPKALVGRKWVDFIHPEDLELTLTEMTNTLTTCQLTNRWQHRHNATPHGSRWVWLEWDIQPVLELGIIYAHARNMTNRFERETQMATWAMITSDLMATTDSAVPVEERKFDWVNEAWSKNLGWSPQELYTMTVTDLLEPSAAAPQAPEPQDPEPATYGITQQEYAVRCKGEPPTYKTYAWMTAVIDGMVYTSGRNIDDEIRHREELHRAIADLELRNSDLERFASIAAHQLRSPPRTIAGIVQALTEDYGHLLDAEGKQFLADIRDDAAQMADIVDGLYRFSKVRTQAEMTLEPVDLNILLQEMRDADVRHGLLENQDTLTWTSLPVVLGDRVLLMEVFRNLVENALKFNESAVKTIEVSAVRRADHRWVIQVKDNGIGIDPKYQHKVFQMFQRVHPRYKGTGVGLALVSAIVQRMGGIITLESDGVAGTTFFFDLEDAWTA